MTLLQHHLFALALIVLTTTPLGIFLLRKGLRKSVNRIFALYLFSVGWWGLWELLCQLSPNKAMATTLLRLEYLGVCFIPTLFYHGVAVLAEVQRKLELTAGYALSVIFTIFIVIFRHPLFLPDAVPIAYLPYWGYGGSLYPLFILFFATGVLRAHQTLWQSFRKEPFVLKRRQLQYLFVGSAVAYLAAVPEFSLKFGIHIPILAPFGLYTVPAYVILIAYTIVQFNLFDIQVVIRRSILYSLFVALLVAAYFGLVYAAQRLFQITLLQHHILALSLTAIMVFGLGLLVFLAEPKRRLNQIFGLYSLAISGWSFTEAFLYGATVQSAANFWAYLEWPPTIFIAPTFIHTVFLLTGENAWRARRALTASYAVSFVLLLLHLFTNLIAAPPRPVGYSPFVNSLNGTGFLLPFIFLILVNTALWKLWCAYRKTAGQRRTQLKYLFWGSLVGYLGGAPDWFLTFGFYIPFVNPFGIYCVPMYSIATTYAVLQHRLFDVNLVIKKSLIYSLLVTVLTVGYFGLVFSIERIFRLTFGYQSIWLSLAAFALMALLFQPLKVGIQRLIDWLLFHAPHEELVKRMERLEQEIRQAEKHKAVATLATGLSHELKNPMQVIQAYAEYLPERFNDPDFRRQCCEALQSETERIGELIKQLMEFAKPKKPVLRQIEPHRILDSTLELLNNEFISRQIRLKKEYQANGTQIQVDPDQFRQVILNLILNALQAVSYRGLVTVKTWRENGWFTMEVADTGPGIALEVLAKLFQPFTTTKEDGTGLGLSVASDIIKEHGGKISAQNHPGQGASFLVKLPAL